MKIAIKNPAPRGKNLERWGDFHFGKSLEAALVRQGAEVVQHFWPDWDLHEGEDAAIWLRGKRWCTPQPGIVNAIWILSHPSTLTNAELDGFDVVYAASNRLACELRERKVQGVEVMRQCTDSQIFRADPRREDDDRKGLLFVASSRGVSRPVLQWALAAGLTPSLIGQGWEQIGLGDVAQSDYIANSALPALYNAARYGMNDHWGDMAHYQIINNRIFDCLACGLPVISDGFPELAEVASDGVWIVDGPRSFKDAYWSIRLDYPAAREACRALWAKLRNDYTFDARARQILSRLGSTPTRSQTAPDTRPASGTERVITHLLDRVGGLGNDPTKIKLSLLHVLPTLETNGALAAMRSLSTLSAGIGAGPWNMRLDERPGELGSRKFDVIFVEDSKLWKQIDRPSQLLRELVGHLKLGGLISALDPQALQSLRDDPRMAAISQAPLIFRRTVEHLDLLVDC